MFFALVKMFERGVPQDALLALGNPSQVEWALMESCGLHFRNIHAFLFGERGPKTEKTTVLAGDFFETQAAWTKLKGSNTVLKGARDRANKELAHLTSDRISGTPARKACRTESRSWRATQCDGRFPLVAGIGEYRDSCWCDADTHVPTAVRPLCGIV